jgi:hypothetical protein
MPCNHCKIFLCTFTRFCVVHFVFCISFVYMSGSGLHPPIALFIFDILSPVSFIRILICAACAVVLLFSRHMIFALNI